MAEKGVKRVKHLEVRFVDGSKAEYVLPESFDVAGMFTGSPHLVEMAPAACTGPRVGVRWLNPAHIVTVWETTAMVSKEV